MAQSGNNYRRQLHCSLRASRYWSDHGGKRFVVEGLVSGPAFRAWCLNFQTRRIQARPFTTGGPVGMGRFSPVRRTYAGLLCAAPGTRGHSQPTSSQPFLARPGLGKRTVPFGRRAPRFCSFHRQSLCASRIKVMRVSTGRSEDYRVRALAARK